MVIQRDEEPLAASLVVNTPGFGDAVLVGGLAVLVLWPLTKAVSAFRRLLVRR